ncbi:MAG: nicotinate phosphoribosyltransferase [Bacteroidia bacterium]
MLTDLYQLTMAYGYWKSGLKDHEAVFHLFFRKNPFQGGYAIAAGLNAAIDLLNHFSIEKEDLTYLASLKGNDGKPLFESDFLDYLEKLEMTCTVDAVPEGTPVFPHEPLLRIRGPIILGQILETPLLNMLNFQTLIATKASRICRAAKGESVLEFGLRRAQGPDGGLSASRAAYIGGCAATSNVLAGKMYDIPVRGTHAHSWVMSFDSEEEAFTRYAEALPNNCVFLVDTYDTVEGVQKAIEVGKKLREKGSEMVGIRLDSGDLAALSIEARKLFDEAGFPDASIVASNDLDEYRIEELKAKGAKINVWGVGTRLATAYDQPALGGVYKLAAIRGPQEDWKFKIKLSEQLIKVSNPGILQVKRFVNGEKYVADVMVNEAGKQENIISLKVDKGNISLEGLESKDLLVPIFEKGKLVYQQPHIHQIREFVQVELGKLPTEVLKNHDAEVYPVGLSDVLHKEKLAMIAELS